MKIEYHNEIIKEVLETVREALGDSRGLIPHQRKLISLVSIGTANLIELYFHRYEALKIGSVIKHEWLSKSFDNLLPKLDKCLVIPLEKIDNIKEILRIARAIEIDRNDLLYGKPVDKESVLKDKINKFIKLKELTGVFLE